MGRGGQLQCERRGDTDRERLPWQNHCSYSTVCHKEVPSTAQCRHAAQLHNGRLYYRTNQMNSLVSAGRNGESRNFLGSG